MRFLVETLRTVALWLGCLRVRLELARMRRAYPPRPPLIGPIGIITLVGTALVALALFEPVSELPFARRFEAESVIITTCCGSMVLERKLVCHVLPEDPGASPNRSPRRFCISTCLARADPRRKSGD